MLVHKARNQKGYQKTRSVEYSSSAVVNHDSLQLSGWRLSRLLAAFGVIIIFVVLDVVEAGDFIRERRGVWRGETISGLSGARHCFIRITM